MKDTYRCIESPTEESLYKEKGSKFYGYAFPVKSEEEVKFHLSELRKQHPTAGHFCFAWQMGEEKTRFRSSDDGEPNNSAGMPIYGQIQAFDLSNILVVSVRYFGGTKLGVGGLIQAYKTSAQFTLEGATIVERTIDDYYELTFDYDLMNKVMQIVKEKKLNILQQDLTLNCVLRIAIRKGETPSVVQKLEQLYPLRMKKIESF